MFNYYSCMAIDTHIHTIGSGHAYNTMKEIIDEACRRKMDLICITDHGWKMQGVLGDQFYHTNKRVLTTEKYPKMLGNERLRDEFTYVVHGYEANILDCDGTTDFESITYEKRHLKYVICSFHKNVLASGTRGINTTAYIEACKKPYTMALGHIDDGNIPCDFEEIVKAAKKYNVLIEVNNSSLSDQSWRKDSRKNILEYLALCKEMETTIVLGSDAHWHEDIGRFRETVEVLSEVNFPVELIINRDRDVFLDWLNAKVAIRDKVME